MTTQPFDSLHEPIPPLRPELEQIALSQNGQNLIHFYDALGYTTDNFALPAEAQAILSLFDGRRRVPDIMAYSAGNIDEDKIRDYVRFLDSHRLLASPYFKEFAESENSKYETGTFHKSILAGHSFPDNDTELRSFLDNAFGQFEQAPAAQKAKALYAPHVEPSAGLSSYVKAFSAIRNLKPKRVVMLATSHYSGLYGSLYDEYPFIAVDKTFVLPNGFVRTDKTALQHLKEAADGQNTGLSFRDRANRTEHSLEMHLMFLNYIWKHDFNVVPFLVGSFEEVLLLDRGHRGKQLSTFSDILRDLYGDDDDTFFLISGDFSHFGRKFGDPQPAYKMARDVNLADRTFIQKAVEADGPGLCEVLRPGFDATRICGFPPLTTFLYTLPGLHGEELSYDVWDQDEQESAVSFGSILYS